MAETYDMLFIHYKINLTMDYSDFKSLEFLVRSSHNSQEHWGVKSISRKDVAQTLTAQKAQ